MWRCVDRGLTDVLEKRITSIFRVEKSASGKPASAGGCRLSQQSETPAIKEQGRTLIPRSRIFLSWRGRRYAPPKRRLTRDLLSATSQKTTVFIVTTVKISNHTKVHYRAQKSLHSSQSWTRLIHSTQLDHRWPHNVCYFYNVTWCLKAGIVHC
jgi:hypothetical protein